MCVNVCDVMRTKLIETLEEKKRIKELMKTNPEQAEKDLFKLSTKMEYQRTHRPSGISGVNAYRARKHKKDYCERCGATKQLMVHHRNLDQVDNRPENLLTVCSFCHHELHFGDSI